MKQLIFGALIFLIIHVTYAQETKSVSKKSKAFTEEFTVLATNKKVKQGYYKRYDLKGELLMEGMYENNLKVGEWKYYENGELEQIYNFTTRELNYSPKPTNLFKVILDGELRDVQLDTPPSYIGSKSGLNEELNRNITYPHRALKMGVEGRVLVSIWVTENDEAQSMKVVQGITEECDKEVIKALTKSEKNWIAGTKNGQKIGSELVLIIEFKLSDDGNKTITIL